PELEGLGQGRQQVLDDLRFGLSETVEHEVGQIADLTFVAGVNPDAKSRILLVLEHRFDALEAIVAARASFRAKPIAADRQSDFIDGNHKIGRRRTERPPQIRLEPGAAEVHVSLRFAEAHTRRVDTAVADSRFTILP